MSMTKNNNSFLYLLYFYLRWVILGFTAYGYAVAYEKHTTELVSYQSAEEQAKLQLEKLAKEYTWVDCLMMRKKLT